MTRRIACLTVAFLALEVIAGAGRGQQEPASSQPMFSSRVHSVRVDALVTENRRSVAGLRPADFELLDNGVRQQVDLLSYDNVPLDVVLALDTSESVAGPRLEQLRGAAGGLLDHLTALDRAALVTFNRAVVQASTLTPQLADVRSALASTFAYGDTALRHGVFAGLATGQAGAGRSLLIVFSDGIDTASWLPAKDIVEIARRTNVVIYSISTARGKKIPFLEEISAATGGSVLQGEWSASLNDTFLAVLDEFRHRYVLTYSPKGVEPGGWHRLQVRVKGRNVAIKARPGYMATQ
jgi:VWFA-related protein